MPSKSAAAAFRELGKTGNLLKWPVQNENFKIKIKALRQHTFDGRNCIFRFDTKQRKKTAAATKTTNYTYKLCASWLRPNLNLAFCGKLGCCLYFSVR